MITLFSSTRGQSFFPEDPQHTTTSLPRVATHIKFALKFADPGLKTARRTPQHTWERIWHSALPTLRRLGGPKGHRVLRPGGSSEEEGEREGQHLRNPPLAAVAPGSAPGNWARSPRPVAETPATGGASTSEQSAARSPGLQRPPGPSALAPAGARWAAAGTRGYWEARALGGGQGLSSGGLDTLQAQGSVAWTFFWRPRRRRGSVEWVVRLGRRLCQQETLSRSLSLAA